VRVASFIFFWLKVLWEVDGMRIAFLVAAFLLAAGAVAFAENSSLPSASASGKSLGADKYVPALEARAQYITCRVDYQITVLGALSALSPSIDLSDSVSNLESAKAGLADSASAGNLSVFNGYVKSTVEPAMRSAANLSRSTRKDLIASNDTNASGIASMYRDAIKTRLECEKNARQHAKDLAKLALRERIAAAKQKLEAAREKAKERVQAAKDRLDALRERLRDRLNGSNSPGNNTTGYENDAGNGSSLGNGRGRGRN
jgi:hypothetical protein